MYGVTRGVTEGTEVKIFDSGFLNFDWDKDTWTDLGPASSMHSVPLAVSVLIP
jgi:hypothetical protein